ncbi:MAG: hypothetical protein ACMUIL_09880 [bacterium]
MIAIWVLIDGHRRKANLVPWAIGATLLGPIILPYYVPLRSSKSHESPRDREAQILLKGLAVCWALMLAVVSIWGGRLPVNLINNEPLEYRLAIISTKGNVRYNDAIVSRFRCLLDELSQNYVEDPRQIANMSVIVRNKLKGYGIQESLLTIMEGLNQILWPPDSPKKRYSEFAFAYADLRNKGLTHQDAVETIQALVSGY